MHSTMRSPERADVSQTLSHTVSYTFPRTRQHPEEVVACKAAANCRRQGKAFVFTPGGWRCSQIVLRIRPCGWPSLRDLGHQNDNALAIVSIGGSCCFPHAGPGNCLRVQSGPPRISRVSACATGPTNSELPAVRAPFSYQRTPFFSTAEQQTGPLATSYASFILYCSFLPRNNTFGGSSLGSLGPR
jgi:hypothetical protein